MRIEYLQAHPLCERCSAEGKITAAIDVHHRQPVESAHTIRDMERLAYDWHNLQALCIPCHIKTHKEMGKSTRANHQARAQQELARWLDKHTSKSNKDKSS